MNIHMAVLRNFEVVCDTIKGVGVCTGGKYAQKWKTEFFICQIRGLRDSVILLLTLIYRQAGK
jgi:hypothetical protein